MRSSLIAPFLVINRWGVFVLSRTNRHWDRARYRSG